MRFTIIIPVYNAEQTLLKCLTSIQNQRFQEYQVIITDDGSTDASINTAEAFAACDARFQSVRCDHAGTGAARNRGLAHAVGEYILYMDADDYWIREDLLEALEEQIKSHPADVYMYQMEKLTEEGTVLKRYTKPPFEVENAVVPLSAVYSDLVKDGQTLAAAWNKCVRKEILLENNIRFREDITGEDIDWVLQVFSHTRTICLLNIRAYAYIQHKAPSRSTADRGPNDLAEIIQDWKLRFTQDTIVHKEAVAGLVAFEYAICMGSKHRMTRENKHLMKKNVHLLQYGLDRKTKLICRVHRVFGYTLTCLAIRVYLYLRRIW